MPALLFNPVTLLRVPQFLFFWFLAWLSGKKNNPLFTILVIFGIVAFNLIIPHGQLILSIGAFKLTSGALMVGIHRAVTLEGLIMLSRTTIRQDLRIPGLFGELLGESFRIFADLMSRKPHITRENFLSDIDHLMIELGGENAGTPQDAAVPASKTRSLGFVILAVVVVLSWLPLAAALIMRHLS